MKHFNIQRLFTFVALAAQLALDSRLFAEGTQLSSGEYFVTQSRSQEKNYQRPFYARVPDRSVQQKVIEEIVKRLATYDNVQPNNFSIMGSSNGAALANQLVTIVSTRTTGSSPLGTRRPSSRSGSTNWSNACFCNPLTRKQ